jgi:hypothetical protein
LLQEGKHDIYLPNCYFFLKLWQRSEKKSIWCTFHPFVVLTDHNTVTFINKMQNKNQRLTRWDLMLQEYNLIIKHIKCKDNFIANVFF